MSKGVGNFLTESYNASTSNRTPLTVACGPVLWAVPRESLARPPASAPGLESDSCARPRRYAVGSA